MARLALTVQALHAQVRDALSPAQERCMLVACVRACGADFL